jgi:hypothetical protein
MNRCPLFLLPMKFPMPQPGSKMVASSGMPSRAMASWIEAMTVGEV